VVCLLCGLTFSSGAQLETAAARAQGKLAGGQLLAHRGCGRTVEDIMKGIAGKIADDSLIVIILAVARHRHVGIDADIVCGRSVERVAVECLPPKTRMRLHCVFFKKREKLPY
jgi:hypothetical protein